MTLTEAAHWTKRLVWFLIPGFFLFFTITYFVLKQEPKIPITYTQANYACTENAEDFLKHQLLDRYGKSNIPSLPHPDISPEQFKVETDTGRFEKFNEEEDIVINVYSYDNPGQTLTSLEDAKKIAEILGFDSEKITYSSDTTYKWEDANKRELTIRAKNLPYKFETGLSYRLNRPVEPPPTQEEAISIARAFLKKHKLVSDEYLNNPKAIDIYVTNDGEFREAKARIDAELVRVDFKRWKSMISIPENIPNAENIKNSLEKKIEGATSYKSDLKTIDTDEGRVNHFTFDIEVVTHDLNQSNISMYIGGENKNFNITEPQNIYHIDYKNWIIKPEYCGTYNLIPPELAIEEIKAGNGSLIYLLEEEGDRVRQHKEKDVEEFNIKGVLILYYDAPYEQEFLQPVYGVYGDALFENGEFGEFMFYYPAIDYSLVKANKK